MQKNNQNSGGFTLIELLVVVLIIGILASIALPQYTKAVEKSRAAEAHAYLADWVSAQAIYKMANGKYASNVGGLPSTELDIALPAQLKNFSMSDMSDDSVADITLERENSSTSYTLQVMMKNREADGSDCILRICRGKEAVCKSIITGLNNGSVFSGWRYIKNNIEMPFVCS